MQIYLAEFNLQWPCVNVNIQKREHSKTINGYFYIDFNLKREQTLTMQEIFLIIFTSIMLYTILTIKFINFWNPHNASPFCFALLFQIPSEVWTKSKKWISFETISSCFYEFTVLSSICESKGNYYNQREDFNRQINCFSLLWAPTQQDRRER